MKILRSIRRILTGPRAPLAWAFLSFLELMVMLAWLYSRWYPGQMYAGPDAESYYSDAWFIRPPLYPAILHFGQLTGQWETFTIPFVQSVIWSMATAAFCYVSRNLCGKSWWIFTAIFGLFPPLNVWCMGVFSESVAISLCVICVWSVVIAYVKRNLRYLYLSVIFILLLLLTRPAFIYFVAATILFALLILWRKRKDKWMAAFGRGLLGVSLAGVALIFAMSYAVHSQTGVFTPSTIGVNNTYYMARCAGVIDPTIFKSAELREYYTRRVEEYPNLDNFDIWFYEVVYFCQKRAYDEVDIVVKESIKRNKLKYLQYLWHTEQKAFVRPFICGGQDDGDFGPTPQFQRMFGYIQQALWINLGTTMLFVVSLGLYLLLSRRRLPMRPLALWFVLLCVVHMGVVILGAPYDHSRLFIESVPVVLLLIGYAFTGMHGCQSATGQSMRER